MNPFLGPNFEAMDPLEWLARMSDHIPDPGQHRTLSYGAYANRVRATRVAASRSAQPRRHLLADARRLGWGRMVAKVYQVDPLLCTRCGRRMSIVGFVTDSVAVGRILDHLGLSSPQRQEKPPPVPEIARVAEPGEGGAHANAYWLLVASWLTRHTS
jgi:hypothetical protein